MSRRTHGFSGASFLDGLGYRLKRAVRVLHLETTSIQLVTQGLCRRLVGDLFEVGLANATPHRVVRVMTVPIDGDVLSIYYDLNKMCRGWSGDDAG
jgi:hypothetical protein